MAIFLMTFENKWVSKLRQNVSFTTVNRNFVSQQKRSWKTDDCSANKLPKAKEEEEKENEKEEMEPIGCEIKKLDNYSQ